jgi:hypothetical protein
MVQLLTSYLFDTEPVHLNTIYYRPSNEYRQFWTLPHVPGARLPGVPVYVLTSRATGSGAEEFANNLKQMGRATLIGETTIGAAHPVTKEVVQEHFQVRLPYGRPINPISGDDWEGTGIEPHVAVPEEQALEVAHVRVLAQLAESCPDEGRRRDLLWDAEIVESQHTPIAVGEATLARCAGQYGPRGFAVQGGGLAYTHELAGATYELTAMTESRFRLDDDVKFEFVLGEQGPASAVQISYRDGRPDVTSPRTA